MFRIKNLTCKNFMSVGNSTQAINFDRQDLTLVLGENLDLGGDDHGARNGTGKTTICNALSYAFYGQALTNIRKDNLINKTNAKGMLVTIDFEKDGVTYRIERGRRPGVLVLYKGETAFASQDNDAQGDSRETQGEIDHILLMSHDMFRHVVALNTYTEPFLSLKANDQRTIIEQLLGITVLSEKAELLKEAIRISKETITSEEYRIKAEAEATKKIAEQLDSLKRRQVQWDTKHQQEVEKLEKELAELLLLDVAAELRAHELLKEHKENEKALLDLTTEFNRAATDRTREHNAANKITKELRELVSNVCHSCGQEFHGAKHEALMSEKKTLLAHHETEVSEIDITQGVLKEAIAEVRGRIGKRPATYYDRVGDAHNHKTSIDHTQFSFRLKKDERNPYTEQVAEMEVSAILEIDYSLINATTRIREHQEFLLKLLTNKDSVLRKRIIAQNLTYLNARLSYYLDKIGLPHTVIFQSDLSVSIEELGRELDFDNLSRGERGRLILSLSWAFRDVWESLYEPINLLFVDELIDNGLDSSGVENAMTILKKMARDAHKSVWLVSHKDELTSRVGNILSVQKEGGFTSYNNDLEAV